MLTYYFILGVIFGILFIVISFGTEIKEKSKPKIKINIPPFVKESRVVILNRHFHHWLIAFLSLCILYYLNDESKIYSIMEGFMMILIIHGLLYRDCFDFSVSS